MAQIRAHSAPAPSAPTDAPAPDEPAERATDSTAEAAAAAAARAAQAERIADLTRQNHRLQAQVRAYAREQKENTRLIGEYETAVGQLTELVRDFASKRDLQLGAQAREYNSLLQEERDQHLQTRLARDEWQASYARAAGMLRTAYALRCAEEEMPLGVVQALQEEVRALRKVVGLEEQREEHEAGWPVLKDALAGDGSGEGEV